MGYVDQSGVLARIEALIGDMAEMMSPAHDLNQRLRREDGVAGIQRGVIQLGELVKAVAAMPAVRLPVPAGVLNIAEKILADPHRHHHLVQFREDGWTLQHPVMERIDGSLFDCDFNGEMSLIQDVYENDSAYEDGLFELAWQDVPGHGRTIRLDEVKTDGLLGA